MVLRRSIVWLREKNALYSRSSSLPEDFYHCCYDYFKIVPHAPTYIGIRDSQVRGLFLSSEPVAGFPGLPPPSPLKANQPIFSVPLANVYSTSNIDKKPSTLHHTTVEQIEKLIPIDEFKKMAPHFYLGLQFAVLVDSIPEGPTIANQTASVFSGDVNGSIDRYIDIQRSQANPWARMLEDEDFNEAFILNMYGGALDKWQRENYDEMTIGFHRCISAIHEGLRVPMKLDHLRRISRLVLARAEHLPPEGYWQQSRWKRRLARHWRSFRNQREPTQLAMVPLLDMVNHSNRPNCAVRIGPSPLLNGAPAVSLYTMCEVLPGQELCRHYNFSLTRSAALFRYGFLPFDLISIVDIDPVNEHLFKNQHQMRPPEEAEREKEEKQKKEVQRLEAIFQQAKATSSSYR